jgi:hypothetical protein
MYIYPDTIIYKKVFPKTVHSYYKLRVSEEIVMKNKETKKLRGP